MADLTKWLSGGMWGLIEGLVALTLLSAIGLPVANYFFSWLIADVTHGVAFIGLALVGYLAHACKPSTS